MARLKLKIGYANTIETEPGIWEEQIVEKTYIGDLSRNISHKDGANEINTGIKLNNSISVMADTYAHNHFPSIKYVTFENSKWEVSSVELRHPRLIINFGGLYHG